MHGEHGLRWCGDRPRLVATMQSEIRNGGVSPVGAALALSRAYLRSLAELS
jgi:hypothetical protein